MDEKKTKLTPQKKARMKRATSLILIVALLITGAFAFLTATDSKTNVFTVGNINIELWEDFDPDRDGTATTYNATVKQPPTAENLLPGEEVTKEPYVKNTGSNPAWTFLTVAVPCVDVDDIIADANGHAAIAGDGSNYTIDIKAYGIQDKYGANTNDTAAEIWTAYAADIDGNATELSAAAATDMRQIFTLNGIDTTNWTQIGDVYKSSDGHFYYVYAYNTILPVNDGSTNAHITSDLFTSVSLIDVIGETSPVVVAYFAPIQSGSGSGTGAGSADISTLLPSAPAGYELVHYDEVTPGQRIGDLYWDSSLAKNDKNSKWINVETNEIATAASVINSTTSLKLEYTNINVSNPVPEEYLVYAGWRDSNTGNHYVTFMGVHASFFEDINDTVDSYSIVIPEYVDYPHIDPAVTTSNYQFNIWGPESATSNYYYTKTDHGYFTIGYNGSSFSDQRVPVSCVAFVEKAIGTSAEITSLSSATGYSDSDPYTLGGIDTIVLGANVQNVLKFGDVAAPVRSTVENIIFKNGVKEVCNLEHLPNLENFELPSSAVKMGKIWDCDSLTEIIYPENITEFDAITYCDNLETIQILNKNALPSNYHNTNPQSYEAEYYGPLFYRNPNLTEVHLPKLPVICGYAFTGDESLADIYFPGTRAEWLQTTVYYDHSDTNGSVVDTTSTGIYSSNEFLKNQCYICCTDGDMQWNSGSNNWVPIS